MKAVADDLTALGVAAIWFSERVDLIGEHRWKDPTPCTGWTVRDLVDHVVGGHVFTQEILNGASAAAALDVAMTAVSVADVGPVERPASERQLALFAEPESLDRLCEHAIGTISGRQVLRLRIHDIAIHGWDLDVALGGEGMIPKELVVWSLAELARPGSDTAAHVGVPTSETLTGLLEAFGREA